MKSHQIGKKRLKSYNGTFIVIRGHIDSGQSKDLMIAERKKIPAVYRYIALNQ